MTKATLTGTQLSHFYTISGAPEIIHQGLPVQPYGCTLSWSKDSQWSAVIECRREKRGKHRRSNGTVLVHMSARYLPEEIPVWLTDLILDTIPGDIL